MHSRISRRGLVAGIAALPAALALPATGASAGTRRPQALSVRSAVPHAELNAAFNRYGNSGRGWTGADSTYSLALPGGRQLWAFSDTFLGTVNPDGSRDPDTVMVNNTFIVQRGDEMRTVHGGTPAAPTSIMQWPRPDGFYWLGDSYLGAGAVNVMFLRFERTGPGMWDWVWRENVLARFAIDDLRLLGTYPMPSQANIQWASWLESDGGYTYVHGVEDLSSTKYMHVARVRGDDLRTPWQYFAGDGWSSRESDSARVLVGVANEYSVTRWRGGYLLVTHDTNAPFSTEIVAYLGGSRTGPFTGRTLLYSTPESGATGSYGDPDVITYNSHEHPELRRGDRLVVTYNVNSLDINDVFVDVTKYRPRFIEVQLGF